MTFPENQHPLSEYAARGIGRAYPRTEKQFTHVATFCLTHLNPSVFVITATSIGPPTDSSEEVICRFYCRSVLVDIALRPCHTLYVKAT